MSPTLLRSSSSVSRSLLGSRSALAQTQTRSKHTHATPQSLWQSRTHLQPPPSIPPPMVPKFPMRVILSDGSSFTSYTTAPSPSTKKLTRDVNNNPLWSPASERRGLGEGEEGRLGRFKKRFEGISSLSQDDAQLQASEGEQEQGVEGTPGAGTGGDTFAAGDLDWMSGGEEEKISDKQRNPVKAGKGKGGKKK